VAIIARLCLFFHFDYFFPTRGMYVQTASSCR
jgi:hypothetical protein